MRLNRTTITVVSVLILLVLAVAIWAAYGKKGATDLAGGDTSLIEQPTSPEDNTGTPVTGQKPAASGTGRPGRESRYRRIRLRAGRIIFGPRRGGRRIKRQSARSPGESRGASAGGGNAVSRRNERRSGAQPCARKNQEAVRRLQKRENTQKG